MKKRVELQITDAEWEVMASVWEANDQTPAQIIARVEPLRKRSHRTIRTLLSRLVDKAPLRSGRWIAVSLQRRRVARGVRSSGGNLL